MTYRPRYRIKSRIIRAALLVAGAFVALACALSSLVVLTYVYVASQLPDPASLQGQAAAFKSARFYDHSGELLYEMIDPHGGRRTLVRLDQISPYLRQATVAVEDKNFYRHAGVDPLGILRAIWQNLSEGEIVSGASTIPQQLARNVLLSAEERGERTLRRKIKEAILSAEITRRYSKEAILELYLNEIYYGNVAYGIEAAAETYFGKPAASLSLAESSLLAGLPQSPARYDPFADPDAAKRRQADVLRLMAEQEYITPTQGTAAWNAPLQYAAPKNDIRAPHFVNYVRQQLEAKYGPEVLYRSGFQVYTTLDTRLQDIAERATRDHVATLASRHVSNAALVAIRPSTGELLAMVGSVDFFDPTIDGQVNVAVRLRQPGSSIKPVTYLAAFERGWTPATLIMDVETHFPDGANPDYVPKNYDGKYHGPVLARSALANSYNIPAVKTLQFVTLPGMLEMAHRLGIQSLDRPDYGLSLTLGGGDVTLLEMTGAYAVLANQGRRLPTLAVLRLIDGQGHVIENNQRQVDLGSRIGQQVVSPQHAYLIMDILSDAGARTPAFGANSPLNLSRPAAVKTGTTDDWRDNWTIGYTPGLVAGVWVGNNDNSPMRDVSGVTGAAPIWHDFMEEALRGTPVETLSRPDGITALEICANSGTLPGDACPERRQEIFVSSQLPLGAEHDLNRRIKIDRSTGQLATDACPGDQVDERYFFVVAPEYKSWAEAHGSPQPPAEACSLHPSSGLVPQPFPGTQPPVWPTMPAETPWWVETAIPMPYPTAWYEWPTYSPGTPEAWPTPMSDGIPYVPTWGAPPLVTVIPETAFPTQASPGPVF